MIHRRTEFSTSTKREAWDRCLDANKVPRCEQCERQLGPANTFYDQRPDGEFDHDQPDAMLGQPTLENCLVLCRTCHKRKTKTDIKTIAKSNRVRDRARGIYKPRSITGWRSFNGTVVFADRNR
jgi:hypothetical protein